MAAAASKGRWLLIISAFVAATADDASTSLRGPARDVALAPPGLDLGGDPIPQDAPAPQDAERRDVPPADDEAAPVAGEAGPLVARRLQDVEDGWTIHEGMTLGRRFRIGAIFQATHLSVCKEACLMNDECGSIDFSEDGECQLGDNSQDTRLLPSETFSHYDAPARDTFEGMTLKELAWLLECFMRGLHRDPAPDTFQGMTRQELVNEAEQLALSLCDAKRVAVDGVRWYYEVVMSIPWDCVDLFLPFCDVSERTNFVEMFPTGWPVNPDISGWDVSSGTNFFGMFDSTGFDRDLSGWMIHRQPNGSPAIVYYMFATSLGENVGMDDINKCPCIEGDPGDWRRWCPASPGKIDLSGNPRSHAEAATRDDLKCNLESTGRL